MNTILPFLAAVLAVVSVTPDSRAAATPSPLFGDHAVLQSGRPVAVWGKSAARERVRVSYGATKADAVATADGRWRVDLPSLAPDLVGDLVVQGDGPSVVSHDVVTGDVWLLAGQSNIEFPLSKAENAQQAIAAADLPKLRHFKVTPAAGPSPRTEPDGRWYVSSPKTAYGFSAIGFFFARDLLAHGKSYQGLLNCTWGGTNIESWSSPETLSRHSEFGVLDRWNKIKADYPAKLAAFEKATVEWSDKSAKAKSAGTPFTSPRPSPPPGGPDDRNQPSGCYNGMFNPLAPYGTRGVLWYQGETNNGKIDQFAALFTDLINDFRRRLEQPNLPFLFVQLPNFDAGNAMSLAWPKVREAQAGAAALPATAMAVTIDVGDPADVHYKNKSAVGERLALKARRLVYGETVVDTGPVMKSASPDRGVIRIAFDLAGSSLVLRPPVAGRVSFEIAGADLNFVSADATSDGETVILSHSSLDAPLYARYCWRQGPAAILFNRQGLPAAPFRNDPETSQSPRGGPTKVQP